MLFSICMHESIILASMGVVPHDNIALFNKSSRVNSYFHHSVSVTLQQGLSTSV